MKKIIFFAFFLVFSIKFYAQNNKCDYIINAKLNTKSNTLTGNVFIKYHNATDDTLKFLYVYLWPNAFSKKSSYTKQLAGKGDGRLHFHNKIYGGYIDSLTFFVDSFKTQLSKSQKHPQIIKLILNRPLYPHKTVNIYSSFVVKIPKNVSRLCYYDSVYQFVNWYPKIAKYDSTGWHISKYSDLNPLYSDFGNYTVNITIPKHFAVIGTGTITTKEEKQWIDQLSFNGLKAKDYPNPAKGKFKTITLSAENVNDFIWIASPNFYVLKTENLIKSKTVFTYTFFTDRNILSWLSANSLADTAIKFLATNIDTLPGNYIYIAQGAALNYLNTPSANLFIISPLINDAELLEMAIFNTISLSYFRNILGINEIDFPYLTRGLSSTLLFDYITKRNLGLTFSDITGQKLFLIYNTAYKLGYDQPLDLKISQYDKITYLTNLGIKAAITGKHFMEYVNFLAKHSNIPSFYESLAQLYDNYAFCSPNLNDWQETFGPYKDSAQLSWFFKYTIDKNRHFDYKLKLNHKYIKVKSTRLSKAPIPVRACKQSNDTLIWTPVARKTKISNDSFTRAYLDPNFITTDLNRYNDFAKSGLIKHKSNLSPHIGLKLTPYTTTAISVLPGFYYRQVEGSMFGIIVHNFTIPLKKLSFVIMPLYSPQLKEPFGLFYSKIILPGRGLFPDININSYIDRLTLTIPTIIHPPLYRKLSISAKLNLHRPKRNDLYKKTLTLQFTRVFSPFSLTFYPQTPIPQQPIYKNVYIAQYDMSKISLFRPFNLQIHGEFIQNDNLWIIYAVANKRFHYTSLKNGLNIRLFAGKNVLLSGLTVNNDYRCQGNFLFRNLSYTDNIKNPFAHQFYYSQGGFAYYSDQYLFDNFLISASATSTLPINTLTNIKFYGAAALGSYTVSNEPTEPKFYYEYGLRFDLSVLKIFLPLGGTFQQLNNQIIDQWYWHFRFSINLGSNPGSIYKYLKF